MSSESSYGLPTNTITISYTIRDEQGNLVFDIDVDCIDGPFSCFQLREEIELFFPFSESCVRNEIYHDRIVIHAGPNFKSENLLDIINSGSFQLYQFHIQITGVDMGGFVIDGNVKEPDCE